MTRAWRIRSFAGSSSLRQTKRFCCVQRVTLQLSPPGVSDMVTSAACCPLQGRTCERSVQSALASLHQVDLGNFFRVGNCAETGEHAAAD